MSRSDALRVLVVDDNRTIRELLAEALGDAGYRVSVAEDGADALDAALTDPPDLVVTDLLMPAMDGAALCRRLMTDPRTRAVPVLVVTDLPAAAAGARLAGCPSDAVVHKPYDLDGIRRAAADLLASRPLSPAGSAAPTTRAGLRRVWRAGDRGWDDVPAGHRGRNLAIARAYLESDEAVSAIARRHDLADTRVPAIARAVVYAALGRRLPGR